MKEKAHPLSLIRQVPSGWLHAADNHRRTQTKELFASAQTVPNSIEDKAAEQQKARWFERTGVRAQDSYFTAVIPIHNESATLRKTLDAIMTSDIPSEAHAKFLFITNGCTDDGATEAVVKQFMDNLGNAAELPTRQLPIKERSNVDETYTAVTIGNAQFMHINTKTAGKPNALTMANDIALDHGPVAIQIDADIFPEPDTIPNLFASAFQHIVTSQDNIAIINGSPRFFYPGQLNTEGLPPPPPDDKYVEGYCFAWDPRAIAAIGGVPQITTEDYGIGVLTRLHGYKITHTEDAKSWVVKLSHPKDIIRERARYTRGALQLMAQYPETEAMVRSENPLIMDLVPRMRHRGRQIAKDPSPSTIGSAILSEVARWVGKREFRRNPSTTNFPKLGRVLSK